ncbi:chemokine-like protein TAFA-5 isoform X2 [Brienomyrus brachyistius]|uniref:chemokine-like protein TAFA-5 isoform X2 n=1 Tax=Brienomyrus brachyistius TaxID=42636 RepID=UPI0020B35BA0|nr:chemokine-like protein TAFA-5 isoform X2 [Brienomyrus brachyistius]
MAERQLAAGTCEIVTLDRDSSQPRRTIARQTARCACRKGQIAGTTRARPACVEARIVRAKQWCEMLPCLDNEGCNLLVNKSGWTCTQPGGRVKTTTVSPGPWFLLPASCLSPSSPSVLWPSWPPGSLSFPLQHQQPDPFSAGSQSGCPQLRSGYEVAVSAGTSAVSRTASYHCQFGSLSLSRLE